MTRRVFLIAIIFSLGLSSCNEKEALKKRLMNELYATTEIIIDGKSMMHHCENNSFGIEEDIIHLPALRQDFNPNKSSWDNKSKWDVDIKNGKNYLIIKSTRFKGKYEIEFFDNDYTIILRSDRITLKLQRAL